MQFSLATVSTLLVAGASAVAVPQSSSNPNFGTVPNKPWYDVSTDPSSCPLTGFLTCQPNLADSNDTSPNPADLMSFGYGKAEVNQGVGSGQTVTIQQANTWQIVYCRKGEQNVGGIKVSVYSTTPGTQFSYWSIWEAMECVYGACKDGMVGMGAFDLSWDNSKGDMIKIEQPTAADADSCQPCYWAASSNCY